MSESVVLWVFLVVTEPVGAVNVRQDVQVHAHHTEAECQAQQQAWTARLQRRVGAWSISPCTQIPVRTVEKLPSVSDGGSYESQWQRTD